MVFELTDLLWLAALYLLMSYWWHAKGVKEIALNATLRHCREMDVQLLDQSIALRALWLKRNDQGRLRLWRAYQFEFSANGVDRYHGRIVLLGRCIESIQLEPHAINH